MTNFKTLLFIIKRLSELVILIEFYEFLLNLKV